MQSVTGKTKPRNCVNICMIQGRLMVKASKTRIKKQTQAEEVHHKTSESSLQKMNEIAQTHFAEFNIGQVNNLIEI